MQQPSDPNKMTLKVFSAETSTNALESSTINCEMREEAFWLSELYSRPPCHERVRELLRGLLPPDSPSIAFFANLLASIVVGIACAKAQCSGFRIGSLEARFVVDSYTPPRAKTCMLCLTEYAQEDVVLHDRRCEHHSHRRCSKYYDKNKNGNCVVCSHNIKVIEKIRVSVDDEEFQAEIIKFSSM